MAVEEIDRRLEDRFALLRGGDRSAPDRHQALLTVIEWSWNLLTAAEQRALRRLALFHDGFTLDAAEAVLGTGRRRRGPRPGRPVAAERPGDSRRMSATGCWRRSASSAGCGSRAAGEAGRGPRRAARLGGRLRRRAGRRRLTGPSQFAAIDALARRGDQPGRRAARARSPTATAAALVQLLAALGLFWTMRGEHIRLLALAQAVSEALRDWMPPPELADAARAAVAITAEQPR